VDAMRKTALCSMLLACVLIASFAVFFVPVEAQTQLKTCTINPDGSVEPSDAPITRNGNQYSLTADLKKLYINKSDTTLDGQGYSINSDNIAVSLSNLNKITIKNTIIIGNTSFRSSSDAVLNISGCSSIIITGCTIKGLKLFEEENNCIGIKLSSCNDTVISENRIVDNGGGAISIWYSYNCSVINNFIANTNKVQPLGSSNSGIYILRSYNTVVVGNNITNTAKCLSIWFCSDNTFSNNTLRDSLSGAIIYESQNNKFVSNQFLNLSYSGIVLFAVDFFFECKW